MKLKLRFVLVLLAFGLPLSAYTQAGKSGLSVGESPEEEIVRLSPFEISSATPARYQAAAAGGRIAANIMDTPTTVTVLTRDFINDVGGVRTIDVAKLRSG